MSERKHGGNGQGRQEVSAGKPERQQISADEPQGPDHELVGEDGDPCRRQGSDHAVGVIEVFPEQDGVDVLAAAVFMGEPAAVVIGREIVVEGDVEVAFRGQLNEGIGPEEIVFEGIESEPYPEKGQDMAAFRHARPPHSQDKVVRNNRQDRQGKGSR